MNILVVHPEIKRNQPLDKSWTEEPGEQGQEADHHGGGHGEQLTYWAQNKSNWVFLTIVLSLAITVGLCSGLLTSLSRFLSLEIISGNLLPCDLVPLCLCLHSRDWWLHPPVQLLLLHPGHPHHAHQVCCLHQPNHLLWAEPSVPV